MSAKLGAQALRRQLAQKFLDIRQYAFGISIQSDGASAAQSLCGIALMYGFDLCRK